MVAIKAQAAAGFVKSPDPALQAILLFGTDEGLISERASLLAKTIAAQQSPPGEVVRIDDADLEDDADRLAIELQTMPMFGGRKVVRSTAGRRINAQYLKPLIEAGNLTGILIVEAGNLRPDEALRAAFEKSPRAAAVACYADEARDLETLLREMLAASKLEIAPEARELLLSRLGADRALSRNEIAKLALYVGDKRRIEVDDIDAVVGDAAEMAVDRVVFAAAGGQTTRAVTEMDRALAAGESAQMIILALQRYLQRLHRVRVAADGGRTLDEAMRSLRPPVHFKSKALMEAHCQAWSAALLSQAQSRVILAARMARLESALENAITERLLIEVARLARTGTADRRRTAMRR